MIFSSCCLRASDRPAAFDFPKLPICYFIKLSQGPGSWTVQGSLRDSVFHLFAGNKVVNHANQAIKWAQHQSKNGTGGYHMINCLHRRLIINDERIAVGTQLKPNQPFLKSIIMTVRQFIQPLFVKFLTYTLSKSPK